MVAVVSGRLKSREAAAELGVEASVVRNRKRQMLAGPKETPVEWLLFTNKFVNFTPSFSRTGEIVRAMWVKQYGVQADSVIAIDLLFLQSMLAVTGSVILSDGSVFERYKYRAGRVRPYHSEFWRFEGLHQRAFPVREQGHLLLRSAHESERNLIAESGISGRLVTEDVKPQAGMYVSNETQSKMDWYLHCEVTAEFQRWQQTAPTKYTAHIKLKNLMAAKLWLRLRIICDRWHGGKRA